MFQRIACVAVMLLPSIMAAAVHGDDWAAIKGRFQFAGDPPAASDLKADKDVEVCGKHKLVAEELVVGADKGIANIVVFVRSKDVKVKPGAAATGKAVLDNKGCRFEPHVILVQTGQEFVIKNSDSVGHNSNVATVKNSPSNNLIPAAGEAALKFTSEEAIPAQVTCNIHPWMKAWVVVRPNPYAAISAADGSFEIKDLPVGEVELQFWHEKAGYLKDLAFAGGAKTDAKGRLKLKVESAGNDLGAASISGAAFTK